MLLEAHPAAGAQAAGQPEHPGAGNQRAAAQPELPPQRAPQRKRPRPGPRVIADDDSSDEGEGRGAGAPPAARAAHRRRRLAYALWTILHEATGRAEPTSMGLRRTAPQQVDAMQTEESARQENMPASGVVGEDTDLDVVEVLTEIDVPMEGTSKRKADIPSPTTVVS